MLKVQAICQSGQARGRARGAITMKALTAAICAFALALTAVAPAAAQTRRSFLDAGTEVLPGERKFTDYAFPPTHYPLGVVTNVGGRVGWHQSPLPGPFDLAGPHNPFGW
jgi:hypothetical protein